MNDTSWKSWRARALASILSIALAIGIGAAGVTSAAAQTPDDSASQSEVVDEGTQETPQPEGTEPEAEQVPDPGTEAPGEEAPAETGAPAEDEAADSDPADPQAILDEINTRSLESRATGTCPAISSQEYGFGKGSTYGISDPREGTVLGYDQAPADLGTANQHFAYFPLPSSETTTTYNTGYGETVSMSKYTDERGGTIGFGLAIDQNGRVMGWGANDLRQLSNGSTTNAQSPVAVGNLPNTKFVQVSAGSSHGLALTADGDIWAWGSQNFYGQLGRGPDRITGGAPPAKVNVPGVKFKMISAGWDYNLAVDTQGRVWAWGKPNNGATGGVGTDGYPALISGLSNVNMVSAGYQHSGAVTATGELYMWGYQYNGRLGNGATSGSRSTPVRVGANLSWKQVNTSNASSYGVTTSGALYAWGDNRSYRLGLGDTTDRSEPTSTLYGGVKQVAGSGPAALYVATNGDVYAAGTNTDLQLGITNGATTAVNQRWARINGITGATEVTIGATAAGARAGSTYQPWGWGVSMQSGRGDFLSNRTPGSITGVPGGQKDPWVTSTTTTTLSDAKARTSKIAFGDRNLGESAAGWQLARNIDLVTVNGTKYLRGDVPAHNAGTAPVTVWWDDGKDQWLLKGCYTYTIALKLDPTPSPAAKDAVVDVVAGFRDSREAPYAGLALADITMQALSGAPAPVTVTPGSLMTGLGLASGTATGKVQLSVPNPPANDGAGRWKYPAEVTARVVTPSGNLTVSRAPAKNDVLFADDGTVTPPPTPPYTCDAQPQWLNKDKTSGTVLGFNDPARTSEFIKVPVSMGTLDIVDVSMGAGSATTSAWNQNNVPHPGHTQLYTVTSLGTHTLYLDRAGNVWGLGLNNLGQVGNGTTTATSVPVKVLGPSNDAMVSTNGSKVVKISAGGNHSLAVTADGEIYQWGSYSELGGPTVTAVSTPTKNTPAGVKFKDVSAGSAFSMALSTANRVYTWGGNSYGQLGSNSLGAAAYRTPTMVPNLSTINITEISAGSNHALASTGSSVYGWGHSTMTGTGAYASGGFMPDPNPRPTAIPILNGKQIRQIEAAPDNSYVLTSDTLYAWGSQSWGLSLMPSAWAGLGQGVQFTPRVADLPSGLTGSDIERVFGGKMQLYLTTKNGDVYAAGNNRRADGTSLIGDLGTEQNSLNFPYLTTPAKVPSLSGIGVELIAVGGRGNNLQYPIIGSAHIALDAKGQAYGWGGNQVGQLGPDQASDVTTYVPYKLSIGATPPVTSGTVYFGDPSKGFGLDQSIPVDVGPGDIITEGGRNYFFVEIPKHVVGNVEVYTSWGGAVGSYSLIGCYLYMLELHITSDKYPADEDDEVLVTAYVPRDEWDLTGDALVDIFISAVGNELRLVPGQQLTGLPFRNGEVTTKVKLSDPKPAPTEANGDWKYPDTAIAWIPSDRTKTSLVSDPNGLVVSNDAIDPIPWVWFTPKKTPKKFEVHLWKTGESGSNKVVGMPGSEWRIYRDSTTTPNTPDTTQAVAGFDAEVTNPNTTAPDRQKGWFTADLEEGVYWLVETKAPKGFSLMAEAVQFRVRGVDGSVQALTGRSAYFQATTDWNPASWDETTLTVRDPAATPLPPAGSEPWRWILVLGIVLLGATALLVVRRFFPDRLSKNSMSGDTPQLTA